MTGGGCRCQYFVLIVKLLVVYLLIGIIIIIIIRSTIVGTLRYQLVVLIMVPRFIDGKSIFKILSTGITIGGSIDGKSLWNGM